VELEVSHGHLKGLRTMQLALLLWGAMVIKAWGLWVSRKQWRVCTVFCTCTPLWCAPHVTVCSSCQQAVIAGCARHC